MKPKSITNYVITEHAFFEMKRRGINEEMIRAVLNAPEQGMDVRPGRIVLQSRIPAGSPSRTYLMRVFVDVDRQPAEVVTAYCTSKVSKYWRGAS
ncbi:MAG: DUF4258 domain-containing protein [Nitrospirota bacterium]